MYVVVARGVEDVGGEDSMGTGNGQRHKHGDGERRFSDWAGGFIEGALFERCGGDVRGGDAGHAGS